MNDLSLSPFVPHRLFRSGHAQTLAGAYLPTGRHPYRAVGHIVPLDDGDRLVLHDDCPGDWSPSGRSALLLHGLAGSHASGYMRRIAKKLVARGVRVFRADLRGCGAGRLLARWPYHSGRSDDARAAMEYITRIAPNAPVTMIGFSLGANIALKLLGELGGAPCGNLASAMAVCPPADLAACSRQISRPENRRYDRFFVRLLLRDLAQRRRLLPEARDVRMSRVPRTLWEFDDQFTAVVCGFGTADNYYQLASSVSLIRRIKVPTLILAARDDPMIPPDALEQIVAPANVTIHLTDHGGHLGFVGSRCADADRRWMDWRVVDWVCGQQSLPETAMSAQLVAASRGAG